MKKLSLNLLASTVTSHRKEKKLNQKQLAELTGLLEPTIRKYESGKVQPKSENLNKIANALGVHPSQIDSRLVWNDEYDVKQLAEDSVLWEAIVRRYGEEPASTMNDFLSLTDEGQQKASEYIDYLMQKHKK